MEGTAGPQPSVFDLVSAITEREPAGRAFTSSLSERSMLSRSALLGTFSAPFLMLCNQQTDLAESEE